MKVWALILKTVREEGRCALVSVISTQGSAPRDAGAHMIVTPQGYHGSIGGGTLEWHAIAAAQAMLARGASPKISSHALGPDLGQCCGGQVRLLTEVLSGERLGELQSLAKAEEAGPFLLESVVTEEKVERHILPSPFEGGRGKNLHFVESFGEDHRRVYLFGAGHVGRALVLALAPLSFDITWVDPRPDAFPRAVPQNVTLAAITDLGEAPVGSLVFIISHSHALDLAITDAALRNPSIAHVGLIGSATKRARFEKRLREAGVAAGRVASLICPIGISGIRSKEPSAIAAATAAQIIMLDEALHLATAELKPHHAAQGTRGKW
ncbi:MAG TPA: xanthine dehydrogenase accessory protein XdhC [Aestuariivirga sp.]|nr:xanthine dehydrogenase accessory protein XdhC [Aestuariivirga sp.]